jgi:hypothetical protein
MADKVLHQIHTAHQWNGTRVTFRTVEKYAGREFTYFKTVDLKTMSVDAAGLLQECIFAAPFPIHKSLLNTFLSALKTLTAENEDIRRILSAAPNTLAPSDIIKVLSKIDSYFLSKKNKSGASSAQRLRQFFLDCQKPLANGMLARQTPYITCLQVPKRVPRPDINRKNRYPSDLPISPKAAIDASSDEEVRALVESHYGKTIDKILETCIRVLDEHAKLQSNLRAASSTPLTDILARSTIKRFEQTGTINPKVIRRRTPSERLTLALAMAERNAYQKKFPIAGQLNIKEIPCLDILSMGKGPRARFATLLSLNYLSRAAVTACFIIMLCATAWNPDTLLSLTAGRIRRTAHGYEISGIKSKTNDFHNGMIHSDDGSTVLEEKAAVRAIELLLWHDENVSKNAPRASNSIFVSLGLSFAQPLFEFNVYADSSQIREFTDSFGLPEFTPTDIRPYVERYRYLSSDMHLESSQTRLQHQGPATTEIYVIGDIARMINESNIIRYMSFLGKSVEYVTGNYDITHQLSEADKSVVTKMLLPPTRLSANDNEYLIDLWLNDPEKVKLKIGAAEVEQCVRQRKYYIRNLQKIRQSNPERFHRSDLPRILVCIALNKIIEQGPYRKLHANLMVASDAKI